jgi:hypothetical protein
VLVSWFWNSDLQRDAQLAVEDRSVVNSIPQLLHHVFICITFHWDVTKLVYLEAMLLIVENYKTNVDILIVTDKYQELHNVLAKWGKFGPESKMRIRTLVWQAPETPEDRNPYRLLWAHKDAIRQTLEPHHTAVVYMEDDTRLAWSSLVSWAFDTEILEPLNFTRCFFRTETSATKGTSNMLDWTMPLVLTNKNTVDAYLKEKATSTKTSLRTGSLFGCGCLRDGSLWPCQVHRHFLSPEEPFQGMWIATRTQLARYMEHPYWNKEQALAAKLAVDFGYPERSNSLNIFIDVPSGFTSSCMVPFYYTLYGTRASLTAVGSVEHMRNGYSSNSGNRLGKLPVEEALVVL